MDYEHEVEALAREYAADPTKVAEADLWWPGNLDADVYDEMESALADLHKIEPSDLLGSAVLERLYRLARTCGEARAAELRRLAEAEIERREREG